VGRCDLARVAPTRGRSADGHRRDRPTADVVLPDRLARAVGWGHASEIAAPHGAGSGPGLLEALLSVSCPGARSCLAVGGEIAASTLAAG
jgi:hypothetical protein